MPDFPVVDAHLHIWDPRQIRYPWIEGNAVLDRPFLPDDYRQHFAGVDVEAMVFVQCDCEFAASMREVEWVAEQVVDDPRIRGIVAWAGLERGAAVEPDLAALHDRPLVKGVRRILQSEADVEFCLQPDFVEGARLLARFGFSFDICVNFRQMASVLRFVEQVPDVPMVLDHIGKPSIRDGRSQPWADQMRELARFPNVACKISGVATEAASGWVEDDLRSYIDTAFDAFGFERTMFGSDWPVMLMAVEPRRWVALLDGMLAGVSDDDKRRFWRTNASDFYRLGL